MRSYPDARRGGSGATSRGRRPRPQARDARTLRHGGFHGAEGPVGTPPPSSGPASQRRPRARRFAFPPSLCSPTPHGPRHVSRPRVHRLRRPSAGPEASGPRGPRSLPGQTPMLLDGPFHSQRAARFGRRQSERATNSPPLCRYGPPLGRSARERWQRPGQSEGFLGSREWQDGEKSGQARRWWTPRRRPQPPRCVSRSFLAR